MVVALALLDLEELDLLSSIRNLMSQKDNLDLKVRLQRISLGLYGHCYGTGPPSSLRSEINW